MLARVLKSGPFPTTAAARHYLHKRTPASHLRAPSAQPCYRSQREKHVTTAMGVPDGVFSMGPNTLQIDRRQFHEPIRQNVMKHMQEQLMEDKRGIAVVQVRSAGPRRGVIRDQQLQQYDSGGSGHGPRKAEQ